MVGRAIVATLVLLVAYLAAAELGPSQARAAGQGQPANWNRFYYYPYIYYPHNYAKPQQFDHMYYRYPQDRRIPVYRSDWYNFYPTKKPYHRGSHFILDVF